MHHTGIGHVHWCQSANMVEQLCAAAMSRPATRGGNTTSSQITLGNLVTVVVVAIVY